MRYPAATILLVAIGLHPAANGADDEILAILKIWLRRLPR